MLNRIKGLFVDRAGSPVGGDGRHGTDELQVAAAALMVEAASMDECFDERERAKILELVRDRFDLNDTEARSLVDAAEHQVTHSSQLFGFASIVKDRFSHEERVELLEMLWEVAYVDGELDHLEANLLRRIAGLIYVSDRESGAARKRARRRLGMDA